MLADGYSLVRLSDGVEVQRWNSNEAPPEFIAIPEALVSVHNPDVGWEAEGHRLVQRFLDDPLEPETRTMKLGLPTATLDDHQLIVSRVLVDRTTAEIAAWDAAKHAEDMALSCTRTQFMLAALEIGKLDEIEAFVAALDPAEHRETLIRWKESPVFYRDTPAWDAMAPAIGETPESVTALFRRALTK